MRSSLERIIENMERVIVGKRELLKLTLVALLARGHILLEDVPGVGKTMLVRTLAKSLACRFTRIQFTPDLLPSDVTGVSLYNQKRQEFEYRPGPIMGEIVLADEVNRTSPKTQAALHHVHVERSLKEYLVTLVDRTRHHRDLRLGVSPRGSIALYRAAQGLALLRGRQYVLPDDIKVLVLPSFAHRVILKPEAELQGGTVKQVLQDILNATLVPVRGK